MVLPTPRDCFINDFKKTLLLTYLDIFFKLILLKDEQSFRQSAAIPNVQEHTNQRFDELIAVQDCHTEPVVQEEYEQIQMPIEVTTKMTEQSLEEVGLNEDLIYSPGFRLDNFVNPEFNDEVEEEFSIIIDFLHYIE